MDWAWIWIEKHIGLCLMLVLGVVCGVWAVICHYFGAPWWVYVACVGGTLYRIWRWIEKEGKPLTAQERVDEWMAQTERDALSVLTDEEKEQMSPSELELFVAIHRSMAVKKQQAANKD